MLDLYMFKRFAVDQPLTNATFQDKGDHYVQDWLEYPGMMKINDDWVLSHIFEASPNKIDCEFIDPLLFQLPDRQ